MSADDLVKPLTPRGARTAEHEIAVYVAGVSSAIAVIDGNTVVVHSSRLRLTFDKRQISGHFAWQVESGDAEVEYFVVVQYQDSRGDVRSVELCVDAIQTMTDVRKLLELDSTPQSTRLFAIVSNPHGGNGTAGRVAAEMHTGLAQLGIVCRRLNTEYAGHAGVMGVEVDLESVECIAFVSGDGTIQEFMSGLLQRPNWRALIDRLAIGTVHGGTQNALARGVKTMKLSEFTGAVAAGRICAVDMLAVTNGAGDVRYGFCGVGWGIAADIAAESERYRHLKRCRYCWLKTKWGCLCRRRHTADLEYTTDPAFTEHLTMHPPVEAHGSTHSPHAASAGSTTGVGKDDEDREPEVHPPQSPQASTLSPSDTPVARPGPSENAGSARPISPPSINPDRLPDAYAACNWTHERGQYLTIGAISSAPDGALSVANDGFIDLIIARKGGLCGTLALALRYPCGKQYESPLLDYVKVRGVRIAPPGSLPRPAVMAAPAKDLPQHEVSVTLPSLSGSLVSEPTYGSTAAGKVVASEHPLRLDPDHVVNCDGELMQGPGPFDVAILPSFVRVYGWLEAREGGDVGPGVARVERTAPPQKAC